MSRRTPTARAPRPAAATRRAFLYVEGPRDREIIEGWAQRASPQLAACVRNATVILGGRQPARAREHLARARAEDGTARGLCVLDRDQDAAGQEQSNGDGMELFTWSRRHIESYLLVPSMLKRALPNADRRELRALAAALPAPDDERAWRAIDAKRRLGGNGQRVPWGRLARALRDDELHADVRALIAQLATLFGVAVAPQVHYRPAFAARE